MRSVTARVLFVILTLGCYGTRSARPKGESGDQYLIVASELQSTNQPNVYDAVRQLRPQWLTRVVGGRSGDNTIVAYLDEQPIGSASALTRIPLRVASRVRYLSPTEAQVRYGSPNGLRAAILVESAKP